MLALIFCKKYCTVFLNTGWNHKAYMNKKLGCIKVAYIGFMFIN